MTFTRHNLIAYATMIDSIITWAVQRRLTAIDHFRQHPHEVQREVLRGLLHTACDTEWGQRYGFADAVDGRELAQRLPVSSYEDLYPATGSISARYSDTA